MCGIGGIWNQDRSPAEHSDLRRIMSAIAHRGPEGAAFSRLDGGALLLGFLRLGFTGQGLCQQPIYNADRSIALVYNGEIYDHMALRADLQARGHVFRTESDSEVIPHLYEEHGESFYEYLNGEFSFVLWDSRKEELWLVRDRFGVKPLLWARHRGSFVFASEAKAILALDGFDRALAPEFFAGPGVGLPECGMTAFRGIRSVRPGHVMRVSRRTATEAPYWRPTFDRKSRPRHDAAAALRAALDRAVARRMEGNPPIALSLSSGIDSSIVCGLMARHSRDFVAFSVGYEGKPYDESTAAARTAAHSGVRFERALCTPASLAAGFLESIHTIEVPTNSLTAAARIQMTAAIRRSGLKAVMSGEGSDELFGGYPYFGIEKIWRMPKPGRALREFRIREAHSRGILWDDGAAWKKTSPVYGYASAYHLRVLRTQSTMRRLFSRSFLASMPSLPLDVAMREHAPAELRALAPFDATRVIARSMLASVIFPGLGDRVEMASSLEGRVPYLDRDVVALAYSLGEEDCIDAGSLVQKSVLRRAFGDLLPKGFRAPAKTTLMAPSFKELAHTPLGGSIVHELTSKESIRRAGIFDPTFVRALGAAWRLWPRGDRRHAQLDLLFGFVLCAQALHHVLIEDGLRRRSSLSLLPLDEDRSPGPPEDGAGAPGSS